jgi:hypothetical protein
MGLLPEFAFDEEVGIQQHRRSPTADGALSSLRWKVE